MNKCILLDFNTQKHMENACIKNEGDVSGRGRARYKTTKHSVLITW